MELGHTILLDAGAMTVEVAYHLPRGMAYLRIVTPALNIAVAATHYPNVELVMPGAVLRQLTRSLKEKGLRSYETMSQVCPA